MLNLIPAMIDPMGRYWQQPVDIRAAPMDDTHVVLTPHQVSGLLEYSRSYPSGTYAGKCWLRAGDEELWLCWYHPHTLPGKIGIGSRLVLIVA